MEYKNRSCTTLTYLDNKISILWVTSYIKWLPKVYCTLTIFFWLIKWRLFSWSDTILGYGEALVFYRMFSFTFIIFFKILNFGLISFENSTENRFQSVSVTVKITDNREYRPIFKTLHWRGGRWHTGQVGTRQDHEYQATAAGKLDVSCEKSRKRYVYIDLSSRSNLSHVLLQIGPSIN